MRPLHRRRVGLALEDQPQLGEAVLRLVAERAAIAGVRREPGVDLLAVVVVVEHTRIRPMPRSRRSASCASAAIR